ncbi:MAG: hypothetical protein U0359_21905 [Byssovorax sp.]
MTEKKSLGETVLGWFVVREEDDEEAATDEEIETSGDDEEPEKPKAKPAPAPRAAVPAPKAAAPAPKAPARPAPPPIQLKGDVPPIVAGVAPDQKVFEKVYRAADIGPDEQERVEKTLNLIQSLPTDTPKDVKKQIVEASMKAFGIPRDQIIETGVQQIQALDAFIQHGAQHTQSVLSDAQARIQKLEHEIGEIRRLMELQVSTQQQLAKSTNEQKLHIQAVLEFFGQEDVARVVKASPKLVEIE